MATQPIRVDLDLNQNEIQNAVIQNLASAPSNPKEGQIYFNTTNDTYYGYKNGYWVALDKQGIIYNAGTGIDSAALANGTIQTDTTIASKTDIGDGDIVIQKNGTAIGTINANATTDSTINVTAMELTDISIDTDSTNYLSYDNTTGEINAKVDAIVTASSTNLITSGAVETAISNALVGGMVYKGVWTATGQTDYSSITLPVKAGYMYLVSGSATIGGIEWNTDDYLVINEDVAVGGTITNVKKIDNSEGSDIVRLNSTQTLTNKTIDADDNTISDLQVSNFKSGVVVTTVRPSTTATDTTLATELAIAKAVEGVSKKIVVNNPALTTSSGVVTWTISNTLSLGDLVVQIFEVATNVQVMAEVTITSSTITIKMNSGSNVSANTYKAVIIG